jgi:prepilin-type N-terminal cleavage/methylation domain-containing protein
MNPACDGSQAVAAETIELPITPERPEVPLRFHQGMTLIEALIAVAILGVTLVCMMGGISYMRIQNRSASERLLAGSIASQILEKFKALPYAEIANSTTAASGTGAIYLEGMGTASPDLAWYVPQAGQTQPIPVEDVNSTSSGTPSVVTDKLPEGYWSATITPLTSPPGVTQVTVALTWNVYAGSTQPPITYSLSTMVSSYIPSL